MEPGLSKNGPFYDASLQVWARDPAVCWHNGIYHCFHTAVERRGKCYALSLDRIFSKDLTHWSKAERLLDSPLGFSSPGNVVPVPGGFMLCLQSYPIPEGAECADDSCRLWLQFTRDLITFSEPRVVSQAGCNAQWAKSKRQIDPFLVSAQNHYFLLYKTDGCIGLLESDHLLEFREASPGRPILTPDDTPDHVTLENPCVIWESGWFHLFFAPCRKGRGIGVSRSRDLLRWEKAHYLDFPVLPWAAGGPTAPFVLDDRDRSGKWLLFFHGDMEGPHQAALGYAVSDDLIHWTLP